MKRAQELQLERLQLGSFNNLDGELVAGDLRNSQNLWISFVFGRFGYLDMVELRDLASGRINADEVYIFAEKRNLDALLKLMQDWKADEIGWKTEDEVGGVFDDPQSDFWWRRFGLSGVGPNHAVIRVWWD